MNRQPCKDWPLFTDGEREFPAKQLTELLSDWYSQRHRRGGRIYQPLRWEGEGVDEPRWERRERFQLLRDPCADNGAMIAMAAAMRLQAGMQQATEVYAFDVKPRWPLAGISG